MDSSDDAASSHSNPLDYDDDKDEDYAESVVHLLSEEEADLGQEGEEVIFVVSESESVSLPASVSSSSSDVQLLSSSDEEKSRGPRRKGSKRRRRSKALSSLAKRRRHLCPHCRKPEAEAQLKPEFAFENVCSESDAIRDPLVHVEDADGKEKPVLFLDSFCFYDEAVHLVDIDSGLIEKKTKVYFDGIVKCADPGAITKGIPVLFGGPITSW